MNKRNWGIALSSAALLMFGALTENTSAQRRAAGRARTSSVAPGVRRALTGRPTPERCNSIRDLLVADAQAALTELGVTPPADFATRYRNQLGAYDAACAALDETMLSCLETAPNSIAAVGTCEINLNKPFPQRVNPPMMGSDLVSWHSHAFTQESEAITTEARTQLSGTWQSSDAQPRIVEFRPDGVFTWQETREGAAPRQEGTYRILSPYRLEARVPSMTIRWAFFVDGDRVLLSNQTATGGYPIVETGTTRMGFNGSFYLIDNIRTTPTCRIYGGRFEPMPTTCEWQGEGDARALVITRGAFKMIETGTNFPAYPMRFVERRGHLIPDGTSMFWTRRAP